MSLSLCWVEVPDHGASVSVKCRHHKTVPSSHHPTWYQGYHRYLDISIYLHSDTRHLSAVPPCHNPLSRVTCHAGADADSARVIMNLSLGSCLNAPLAPALLFQCWYLQLRDGGNLKVQLFWSVRSPGWAAAALCRLWLDIYDPRPVRGTLTMRPPSQLWPAQHGGLQSWHRYTIHWLIHPVFVSLYVESIWIKFKYGLPISGGLFKFKFPFITAS